MHSFQTQMVPSNMYRLPHRLYILSLPPLAPGDTSNVDVKSASLAVYDKTEGNFTDTATGLPVVTSKGGPDYRAGGGVTTGIASATDQLGNPVGEPQNTVAEITSFGGTNRWAVAHLGGR